MHPRWMVLALLVPALAAAAPASAQEAPVRLLEDPAGDAALTALGQPAGAPAEVASETDLVHLDILESRSHLTFTVGIAAHREDGAFGAVTLTRFRHADTRYEVGIWTRDEGRTAWLAQYDGARDAFVRVAELAQQVDMSASTVSADVPRHLLVDGNGSAPFPGRLLEDLHTFAWTIQAGAIRAGPLPLPSPVLALGDRMPDAGFAPQPFVVRMGLAQTGHAMLGSEQPFRASNGEASTFVFRVDATNHGPAEDRFAFRALDTPMGWTVRMPPSSLAIPARTTITLPVVVQTEFGHRHGESASFILEMASLSDRASVGRVELGLRYADPPQPAGHHNVLTFHTSRWDAGNPFSEAFVTAFSAAYGHDVRTEPYMNADPDDELDTRMPAEAAPCEFDFPPQVRTAAAYCWFIPLAPRLELGLDFDLAAGPGKVHLPIRSAGPMPGAVVGGALYFAYPAEEQPTEEWNQRFEQVRLADITPTAPLELGANAQMTLDLDVVPTPESDLVPWRPDAQLWLVVAMTTTRPQEPFSGHLEPELLPGGSLQLPLLEYADPVQSVFFGASTALLEVEGAAEKLVNPGEAAVFTLQLRNLADADATFHFQLAGSRSEWAQIVGSGHLRVPAQGSVPVRVLVRAPADAPDGAVADLVVEATSIHDVTVRGLARLKTTVDRDADLADESALAGDVSRAKGMPAPAPALGLLALAAFALALRRRK